jgi:hypothetical protein
MLTKPLVFLVDDGSPGFWEHRDCRAEWDTWSRVFELRKICAAGVGTAARIIEEVNKAPGPKPLVVHLVTDAKMWQGQDDGLDLARQLKRGQAWFGRAVIYSVLAPDQRQLQEKLWILVENRVGRPHLIPRLQRFLLDGVVSDLDGLLRFWNEVRSPWRRMLNSVFSYNDLGQRKYFRPAVSYGHMVGDPLQAEFWLDPMVCRSPNELPVGVPAPFSIESGDWFCDQNTVEGWHPCLGGTQNVEARDSWECVCSSLAPRESLESASSWWPLQSECGALRLLWELVQCGGDPRQLPSGLAPAETNLPPRRRQWVREKRLAIKRCLGRLELLSGHEPEIQRLLLSAQSELELLESWFSKVAVHCYDV